MRPPREPLVAFVILGTVLYLAYVLASGVFSGDEARTITIDESEIELLADGWQRQWQRSPTADELEALVDGRVREEVLYREALAMGLDRNDVVVRRRMVQKLELLSQDLALLADPTEAELRSFFAEREEEYRLPPRLSFSHVYFNVDRRADPFADAERLLERLRSSDPIPDRAPDQGDRFMPGYDYPLASPLEVQRAFGAGFAADLFRIDVGWQGPIASGYGVHLVHVTEKVESRLPAFEEVRERVVNDFDRVRRERANEALYQGLRERYEVEIDEAALERRTGGEAPGPDSGSS